MTKTAIRQGDVYLRPITEPVVKTQSQINWAALGTLLDARLKQVTNTRTVNKKAAVESVVNLYAAIGRSMPDIHLFDGTPIPAVDAAIPIRGLADTVWHNLVFQVPEIDRVMRVLGFDPAEGQFRLTRNKLLMTNDFRVRASNRRPPWTRDLGNLLSQFDTPALVLYDLAASMQIKPVAPINQIAEAIRGVLDNLFGVLMFESACYMIARPHRISLDPMFNLSATMTNPRDMSRLHEQPALQMRYGGEVIYAVNGIRIPVAHVIPPIRYADVVNVSQPRLQSAIVEYIGWEHFFEMVPRDRKELIDRSKYGELWDINMGGWSGVIVTVVKVKNSTAEPDGSFRRYVIPVDAQCRPLPNPLNPLQQLGEPQERTALNAVASTFYLTGEEYARTLARQS